MYPHGFFQLTNKMSSEPEDLDPSSPWKKRDVYLVIIACVTFIFLCYYSLFKLLLCVFNRASSSRNQDQGRLQSHGLEFSAIHALPIFQFKKNDGEQKPINEDCAICLGDFEEGEWVKHLPSCTHCFHVSCIDLWLQSHSNCPLCRSHVPRDIAVDLEGSSVSSSYTLLETLRRENFSQERDAHLQYVHSEILQNLAIGQRSRAG